MRAAASSTVLCDVCGARLWHDPQHNPRITILKPGTLENTAWLDPVGHIWVRSAQPWFAVPEGSITYEAQPPNFERLIEAWRARPR
jgi:hypothetical protein